MITKNYIIINRLKIVILAIILFFIVLCEFFTYIYSQKISVSDINISNSFTSENQIISKELYENSNQTPSDNRTYIKWVDFKCTSEIMYKLASLDISSHKNNEDIKFNWIELMSLLACKYGGEFSKYKQKDLDDIITKLQAGITVDELSSSYKLYNYFYESFDAIFHEYIGNYTIQIDDGNNQKTYKSDYGIKVFSPIARGYNYSHYKDFRCITLLWL